MDIGERIVQLREKKGWSTNRLANLSGLSQSFLRSVELGEKGISVENLELLCQTLDIPIKNFFDVPNQQDTIDDTLHRQIECMNIEQKQALLEFLRSML